MEIKDEPLVKIDCKQGLVKAVRYNADGQYAMTCGSDRTIKLWRPSKLLQLKCYKGHSAEVNDCQANQNSSEFLSCSNDKSVIAWDVETGKILRRFRNLAPFNTVCYGGQSASVALASSVDGTLRIYDMRATNSWEPIQSLTEATDSVTCCQVYKHLIFTTSMDKKMRTYDLRNGSQTIDTFNMPLNHIAISENGDSLLVVCFRGSTLLFDRNKGDILLEYEGNDNKLFKIESTFVLNNTHLAAGSEDGKVYIWSISNEKPQVALKHSGISLPVIQSISTDSLDHLLTACGNFIFMWLL